MLSARTSPSNTSNEQMHGHDNEDDDDANDFQNLSMEYAIEACDSDNSSDTPSSSKSSKNDSVGDVNDIGNLFDISKSLQNLIVFLLCYIYFLSLSLAHSISFKGISMAPTAQLWNTQSVNLPHDCEKIEQENVELKRKLEKTRKAFEKTWAHLRISNQRKEQIEKDIRNEIYKTHNVLKSVRSNMENANNNKNQ